MSGHAASRTPKTSSSRNSAASKVQTKSDRLRRAPARTRAVSCADDMNGDSPFHGSRNVFVSSRLKTSRSWGRNHRARERAPQPRRHARTPACAARRRRGRARLYGRVLPGREACALALKHAAISHSARTEVKKNFSHRDAEAQRFQFKNLYPSVSLWLRTSGAGLNGYAPTREARPPRTRSVSDSKM